jgi:transcriptional regulator with XRE-family HTH domain
MKTTEMKKGFGERLKKLRKQRQWTQKEMAAKVDVEFSQFNKYECGLYVPPAEKLVLLAELLDTTVDYLLTGNNEDASPLHSIRLLERFRALEKFEADDQETVIKLIDAMIVKKQVEGVIQPHLKS